MTPTLFYGLPLPEDTVTNHAWGARAITNAKGMIDIVHNRQDLYNQGTQSESNAFIAALNHALPQATETYKNHLQKGTMSMQESKRVTLFDSERLRIDGNTNGSCGYLYLVAWSKSWIK